MRNIIIASLLMLSISQFVEGQTADDDLNQIRNEVATLHSKQATMQNTISLNNKNIVSLTKQQRLLLQTIDSLNSEVTILRDSLSSVNIQLSNDITKTNNTVSENNATLNASIRDKSLVGVIIIVIVSIVGFVISLFIKRKVSGNISAIEKVKDVQSQLQSAQKKIEEQSVQLDNKLIDMIEKIANNAQTESSVDHSLTLKVADEITRIELNLSRMDSSIKGYKQLAKGVERIKNNFLAKGYEIANMLGKQYNEGMRINADFVLDESLEPGTRIITSITKPQVTYNGEMIQKAIVTVTQNI